MKSEELRRALHLRDQLFNLVQVDADAVGLYSAAIEHVIDDEIYNAFQQFQLQHREHVNELCRAIQRIGWATPEFRVDLKGHLGEIGVRLGSLRGAAGALQVVSIAEKTHCARYAEAQEWEIGDSRVRGLLRAYCEDEKDHLAFVEQAMAQVGVSGT